MGSRSNGLPFNFTLEQVGGWKLPKSALERITAQVRHRAESEKCWQSIDGELPLIFLVFGECFGPSSALGCVLRTASASIWRSSAFVFGGSRVIDACH